MTAKIRSSATMTIAMTAVVVNVGILLTTKHVKDYKTCCKCNRKILFIYSSIHVYSVSYEFFCMIVSSNKVFKQLHKMTVY